MLIIILTAIQVPNFEILKQLARDKKNGQLNEEQFRFLWESASKVLGRKEQEVSADLVWIAGGLDLILNSLSNVVTIFTCGLIKYKPIFYSGVALVIVSNLYFMKSFRHLSIIPLKYIAPNRLGLIIVTSLNFILVTKLVYSACFVALIVLNIASENIPYGYLVRKLRTQLLENRIYYSTFVMKYVAPYNSLVYQHLKINGHLKGHLNDYLNPSFQEAYTFDNFISMVLPSQEVVANVIQEPPYEKMDITNSFLFLKTGSKRRFLLLLVVHALPLPRTLQNGAHIAIICSSLRLESVKNGIQKFRLKLEKNYA